ncbi:SynChlorMet cassette protein ScmC [uncultured Methanospirillum sp.]|uniref:SynChlorMet cassette protein ScmC n=1 Tax=uncultured Methanospirillum sp. TaxID=262503 RepID=UPI0029C7E817|nr:SynChlorMet cassette protein ScmC [uncultured Methanospirillum sp.]
MYTLSLPREHHWTITADPDRFWWLEAIAPLLTLSPGEILNSGLISVAPLLPEDPIRSEDWQVFGSVYGKIALNQKQKLIEIGIPNSAADYPEHLSSGIKLLMVGISAILLSEHCLLLHAATLVHDGQAVLLAASSGGGKSTSARRVPPPWSAPGDENCLVIPDGFGGYLVSVLPTASKIAAGEEGLFWNPTLAYPLKAICILKQADEDTIESFPQSQAAVCMTNSFSQATWNQFCFMDKELQNEMRTLSFGNACSLVKEIPVYLLSATLTGRFWEVIEQKLFR